MISDAQLAAQVGIPVRVVAAIRVVESDGSTRAVRFEPHLFHARTGRGSCLPKTGGERCSSAEILAQRIHTSIPYAPSPGRIVDHVEYNTNRAAFNRAYLLDPNNAVRSSSWGLFQVLGGAGIALYGSPAAFVRAFDANPGEVSQRLLVQWFRSNERAVVAANAGDWAALAEVYNNSGPGDRWYSRFTAALSGETGAGIGIGFVAAVGAGLFAWWKWGRR
jgi:hypothetical protein